jgi:cysteinyl-tRNA synthetase
MRSARARRLFPFDAARRFGLPADMRSLERPRAVAIAALLALLVAALFAAPPASAQSEGPSLARVLAAAKSWGYQLQKIDPDTIAAVPHDVLVLDYSRDGSDGHALTAEEVGRLKVKPDGSRRIVLAYLSIGEAEVYRYYWQWYWFLDELAPAWRGGPNKEWHGNYDVRYWHEEWQDIIFRGPGSYLERIVRAGFDGAYLDKVDEYESVKDNPDAAAQMIALVKALAGRARALRPGFLIVPQNAEELLADADYRAAIDGIGKEDLLFGEVRNKRPNRPARIESGVALLKLLTRERKPVFVVEYIDAPQEIAAARKQLEDHGFVPLFADRALDMIRDGDPPAPGRRPGRR